MMWQTAFLSAACFCFPLLIVSHTCAAKTQASPRSVVPSKGFITCKSKHYTVTFAADRAWTIRDITYDGRMVSLHNGFHGTVLKPRKGNWWGTGHTEGGREIVHELRLIVDGKEKTLLPHRTYEGHTITLRKRSTIWKFDADAEVTVTDDLVIERTRLQAREDCQLALLYYFMHCTPPTTSKWIAELPDGNLVEGKLTSSGKMRVNRTTRWLAQFDPVLHGSILYFTPKVITGPHSASMIWDLKHYHKYYLRQNKGQAFQKGDVLDYSVLFKVVAGEKGDWSATKQAAASLEKEFKITNEKPKGRTNSGQEGTKKHN